MSATWGCCKDVLTITVGAHTEREPVTGDNVDAATIAILRRLWDKLNEEDRTALATLLLCMGMIAEPKPKPAAPTMDPSRN